MQLVGASPKVAGATARLEGATAQIEGAAPAVEGALPIQDPPRSKPRGGDGYGSGATFSLPD